MMAEMRKISRGRLRKIAVMKAAGRKPWAKETRMSSMRLSRIRTKHE
jgi:hypothetical protein